MTSGIKISNPFAGYPVTWTDAQHKAAGYQGGTDYGYPKDAPVRAPADGRLTLMNDGLNGVRVTLADGRSIVIRENRSITGTVPRMVKEGEQIAISARVNGAKRMYEHIEGWENGKRIVFEPMIYTPPALTPTQRQAKAAGVFARLSPDKSQAVVDSAAVTSSSIADFDAWTPGEAVEGNDIWFSRVLNGVRYYYWSGGFTDSGVHDLKDIGPNTVYFDTGDGEPTAQIVAYGGTAVQPADPVKDGFTFVGWLDSVSGTPYNFATPVMTEIVLLAEWKEIPVTGGPSIDEIVAVLKPYFAQQSVEHAATRDAIRQLESKIDRLSTHLGVQS